MEDKCHPKKGERKGCRLIYSSYISQTLAMRNFERVQFFIYCLGVIKSTFVNISQRVLKLVNLAFQQLTFCLNVYMLKCDKTHYNQSKNGMFV